MFRLHWKQFYFKIALIFFWKLLSVRRAPTILVRHLNSSKCLWKYLCIVILKENSNRLFLLSTRILIWKYLRNNANFKSSTLNNYSYFYKNLGTSSLGYILLVSKVSGKPLLFYTVSITVFDGFHWKTTHINMTKPLKIIVLKIKILNLFA